MSILHDIPVFRKGIHQLTLINTDLSEAESLVRELAEEEKNREPREFAGMTSCVYFKMPYVQPCDSFRELRRLILRVRENTGLRADFKGIVAIEATEWLGHEKDAYFTVLLKYLYDHRDTWRAAFILNHATPAQFQRFTSACACYVTPRMFDVRVFSDRDRLCRLIHESFRNQCAGISLSAAEILAEAMGKAELKNSRSLTLIERTTAELIAWGEGTPEVDSARVRDYLTSPCSTLTMMAGKPLMYERSMDLAKESIQL